MKLHNSEVLISFLTTKISWIQNLKTASIPDRVLPRLNIFCFSPIGTPPPSPDSSSQAIIKSEFEANNTLPAEAKVVRLGK